MLNAVLHPLSFSQFVVSYVYLCLSPCNSQGSLEVVLDNREREDDCFYLFKLDSSAVCPAPQSQLSTGSIILIMSVMTVCNDTKTLNINYNINHQ